MKNYIDITGENYHENVSDIPKIKGVEFIECTKRRSDNMQPVLDNEGKFKTWLIVGEDLQKRAERIFRKNRDKKITKTDWIIFRHKEQLELSIDTNITTAQYTDLLTYRQALRDSADTLELPSEPTWLK